MFVVPSPFPKLFFRRPLQSIDHPWKALTDEGDVAIDVLHASTVKEKLR